MRGGGLGLYSRTTVPSSEDTGDSHFCFRPTSVPDRPRRTNYPGGGVDTTEEARCFVFVSDEIEVVRSSGRQATQWQMANGIGRRSP